MTANYAALVEVLTEIAKTRRPRVQGCTGVRATTSRRRYICYVCDAEIDSESARHRQTKRVQQAIREHVLEHADLLDDLYICAAYAACVAGDRKVARELLAECDAL